MKGRPDIFNKTPLAVWFLLVWIACLWAVPMRAAASGQTDFSHVAGTGEYAAPRSISKYGMLPVYGRDVRDGSYSIEVKSSSTFFRIIEAVLEVKGGEMEAALTISSHSYTHLYPGTGMEASVLAEEDFIPAEDVDGKCTFRFPVEALDRELPCAAFSRNRKKWYDRNILFDASTLPEEALLVELPDYDRIEAGLKAAEELAKTAPPEEEKEGGKLVIVGRESAGEPAQETGGEKMKESGREPAQETGGEPVQETGGETVRETAAEESTAQVSGGSDPASEMAEDVHAQGATNAGNDPYIPVEAMQVDLEDGEYAIEVNMTGGSGRASVSSPTYLIIKDSRAYARLIWSSVYYDYMIVGGVKYLNESTDGGNSSFTIPIAQMDAILPVIADTTAMGDPVPIHYSLTFYRETIGERGLIPQEAAKKVLVYGAVVIVGGGILNYLVKKRKKR